MFNEMKAFSICLCMLPLNFVCLHTLLKAQICFVEYHLPWKKTSSVQVVYTVCDVWIFSDPTTWIGLQFVQLNNCICYAFSHHYNIVFTHTSQNIQECSAGKRLVAIPDKTLYIRWSSYYKLETKKKQQKFIPILILIETGFYIITIHLTTLF